MKMLHTASIVAAALTITAGAHALEPAESPPEPPALDILFLVDDSGSMGSKQAQLVAGFPAFINNLGNATRALPDLHIGIISANTGVGPFDIQGCGGNGDNGRLQFEAQPGCTGSAPDGHFIVDGIGAGGERVRNYTGALEDSFACIAKLGTTGCGFEQQLESIKRSLDGQNPENLGFLRKDAFLAIVIVSDEDDCSALNPAIYDTSDTALTGTLGPLSSFRCTEFGVECAEGRLTRAAAQYTDCRPRTDSFVRDPADYASFVKGLKVDPGKIFVGTIIGDPEPVRVELNDKNEPELAKSCMDPQLFAGGDPGVRLEAFAQQFPLRNAFGSVCATDTSLAAIATEIARLVNGQAPPLPPADAGVPDAAQPPADAGPQIDASGTPVTPDDPPADCGCRVGSGSSGATPGGLALGLAGLLALLVRRRRAR